MSHNGVYISRDRGYIRNHKLLDVKRLRCRPEIANPTQNLSLSLFFCFVVTIIYSENSPV